MKLNPKILPYLLFIAALILPIKPELTTLPFIFMSIYWIISLIQKKTFFSKKNLNILFFLSATFLVGILGLINTSNFPEALFELSRALPLFLLPFILFTLKDTYTHKIYSWILSGFFAGCLLKTVFILIHALIRYLETGHLYYFFYTSLLPETGSFTYYLGLAYYLGLFVFYKKNQLSVYVSQKVQNLIVLISILLFAIVIIQLQTKSVIIYFYVINIVFLILYFKKFQSRILLYTLLLCSVFMLAFGNQMRFVDFFKAEKVKIEEKAPALPVKAEQKMESTSLRYNSIITTVAIIKEHFWLGVGTGDLTDEMTKKYEQLGFIYNFKEQTNPHNQYLRTFGKNGILGILALLGFFIFNFLYWLKTKSPILLAFNLIILLSCLTNDLFDTGGGTPFIGLLLPVIYLWSKTFSISSNQPIEINKESVTNE